MKIHKILLLGVGVLIVATVSFAIKSVSLGTSLFEIEEKIRVLETENKELKETLVKNSSLTQIGQKAKETGMIKPEKVTYIYNDKPVAVLP